MAIPTSKPASERWVRAVNGGLKVDDADNGLSRGLYDKPASKQ